MRKIIHISDLHFGRIDRRTVGDLLAAFQSLNPDLIIISGDISQRAWPREFKSAKRFLEEIRDSGFKYFVIPGNHDVESFMRPFSRLFNPYKNYKKYISENVESYYVDEEIAVASINTVRPLRVKNGNINEKEVKEVQKWLTGLGPKLVKIMVSHHPLDLPSPAHRRKLAKKSSLGMELLSLHNIDMYLAGHHHRSSSVTTESRYNKLKYHAIAVQAGTVSKRQRGEVQSFNVLTINKPNIMVETYLFDNTFKIFTKSGVSKFKMEKNLWRKV